MYMLYLYKLYTQVVNYAVCGSAEEICASCSKLITFIDLAGHEKYLKTTVFGLTAHRPDAAMLVISATNGVGKMYHVQYYTHITMYPFSRYN